MEVKQTNDKTFLALNQCKYLLRENHETESIYCQFNDRAWIGIGNCGLSCLHYDAQKDTAMPMQNIEEKEGPVEIPGEKICPYASEPLNYIVLGRLCQINGEKRDSGVCFHWSKPDLVKCCQTIKAEHQRELAHNRLWTTTEELILGAAMQ